MVDTPTTSRVDLFGSIAPPLTLEQRSLHRVRLFAATVAALAFASFSAAWDWPEALIVTGLAVFEMGHAFVNLSRERPLWRTLLVDIVIVSVAIAIVRPPALAIITPVVYLVAAPMLLTGGRTAKRLAVSAIVALSGATLAMFEFGPTVAWTALRTVIVVASFLLIFGPLIVWMIDATSRQIRDRERTRIDLEATRRRLEDVFRNAPVGMELTGIGTTEFLAVNPAFCDFLGYTEDQLLAMSIADVVHPADLAAGLGHAVSVVKGELDRFEQERRYIHADGRVLWANFSLSVIRDQDGTPQYAIGQAQDITRRKVIEAERDLLLELSLAVAGALSAEEAMRSVLAGLCAAGGWSVGVLWTPTQVGWQRVHTWAAHPGVDRWAETTATLARGEGFVGAVAEAGKPLDVPSIAEDRRFIARREAADIGLGVALGVPVIVAGDVVGVFLFLGVPEVDPHASQTAIGAVVGQLGQALAVRLAEAERDQLAEVLQHTTDFAGFADKDGRVRYINPAGREMLGMAQDEDVTAFRFDELHPPETASIMRREVFPAVVAGGTWRGEAVLLARDGRLIPISQVVLAHYDDRGEVSYLSTVARDITAQKQLESQQKEAIRSKDEFIASVSHELRTPLTAVRGFAEILKDAGDGLGEGERREMIATIASESADVSDIVEDLLVAARSDIDQLTISVTTVDTQVLVEETVQRLRWGLTAVEVRVDEGCLAAADPLRLRQILRNLMVNAIRYGGSHVRVTATCTADEVVISVEDDGDGISESYREEIFAPYRRAHDRAGLAGSVGLGLAVSRRLARLMGGDVTYSHIDGWSTFRLSIPAASAAAATSADR